MLVSAAVPNAGAVARDSAMPHGFGGNATPSCIIELAVIAWNPRSRGDDARHDLGVRGMRPRPASPVALFGSTEPAIMWSSICRGSQSAM
jgi:hypothetical protein